jgi:hypothetical protein
MLRDITRNSVLTLALLASASLSAQEGFGKLDPAQPTGISVPDLITRMAAREAEFAAARENYTFRQDVKFNTISDETNKPDGEYRQVTDVSFDAQGRRVEHVVFAPQNTIERVIMTENDMKDVQERLPFILTTPELPDYDIKYLGRQHVDELDTYVLDVAPKKIEKNHRYFQGKVWVDTQDYEIVTVSGMNVPQIVKHNEDLSPPFMTYYEQIDGKYWFPTYTKAEGTLHFSAHDGVLSQDTHVRSTIHYTDYKRFRTSVTIKYNGEEIEDETKKKPASPKQ